jgi:hypothetical protein
VCCVSIEPGVEPGLCHKENLEVLNMAETIKEKKISYPVNIDGKLVGVIWKDTLEKLLAGTGKAVPIQYKTKDMKEAKTIGWINTWKKTIQTEQEKL